ncbi:hypothetical protein F4V91_21555 [Neorhizobium galegae]|uniref:Uncharacterized protein n=1 Tax=Neorhizobium galegae TaxID=399 RepID=A0A6A1U0Z2_NEOGA|nr:hypothetical protein F4V91_21555 [Neorhizobium galegae]
MEIRHLRNGPCSLPDPPSVTLGTIDPTTALYEDIDLPGGDLSRRPDPTKTSLECRLACIWNLYVGARGKRISSPDLKHVQNPIRFWNC